MTEELSTRIKGMYCVKTLEITDEYVIYINYELITDATFELYENDETFTCHAAILPETWYLVEMNPGAANVCTITETQQDENDTILIICCSVFGIITLAILGIVVYQLYQAHRKKLFIKHYSTNTDTESLNGIEELTESSY